ncbi:hypothetical protein GJU40_16255 [Bacillus lacus]|uniref:Uncharacterized protein n=1 Tax=Metabacillus lacus TaxID=1983721 RepID=A0A7X2J1S6_9BACI|nr:hypothetical protein [Metabacillus lacus]MRX73694.1 hypothetical protein [Metabacillus lacus]
MFKVKVLSFFDSVGEFGKDLGFDKRVEQMLISACKKSIYTNVSILRGVS